MIKHIKPFFENELYQGAYDFDKINTMIYNSFRTRDRWTTYSGLRLKSFFKKSRKIAFTAVCL